ncbi:hypothetical protein IF650_03185 [Cellulosimicrobium terreum]|nr:hypothetical protein [Cellulosimicrobium terreum]
MTYDDAAWHSDGEGFPPEVGSEAGATHIGVFLAWAVLHDHVSAGLLADAADDVAALRERATTGGALVMALDGALSEDHLDDVGNAFAAAYYTGAEDGAAESEEDTADDEAGGLYLEDYVDAASPGDGEPEDVYRVPDSWETYDLVAPLIDARFAQWDDDGRPAVLRHRT